MPLSPASRRAWAAWRHYEMGLAPRQADLAHAMMSLPATKGFEVGSGFAGTLMKGTEHNDPFYMARTAAAVPQPL